MVAETVIAEFRREANRIHGVREKIEPAPADPAIEAAEPAQEGTADVVEPEVLREHRARRKAGDGRTEWAKSHSPKAHIRDWARAHPDYKDRVGIRGVLPADVIEAYYDAHPGERSG